MRTVNITLRGEDFAGAMVEMRTWLDQRMFAPARFTYKQAQEAIVVSVDFENDRHAEAFESRFDGQQPEAAFSHRSGLGQSSGDGSGRTATPATMGQARWWRLLAEEIRTEADNFDSELAKETMEMAAQGWENLAEELERRLASKAVLQ